MNVNLNACHSWFHSCHVVQFLTQHGRSLPQLKIVFEFWMHLFVAWLWSLVRSLWRQIVTAIHNTGDVVVISCKDIHCVLFCNEVRIVNRNSRFLNEFSIQNSMNWKFRVVWFYNKSQILFIHTFIDLQLQLWIHISHLTILYVPVAIPEFYEISFEFYRVDF